VEKTRILLAITIILLIASVSSAGDVIYVDVYAPNDPGTGTFNDPFLRIQDAINSAVNGDTVEIRPGIYTADPNNYDLDPRGKSITIRSVEPNDPNIVANTIIDPNRAGRGFYIQSGEDPNCVISGLTIRNACALIDHSGAGIYCYNSSPTVRNCAILSGYAESSGGGICLHDSNAVVIDCVIMNNIANYYGGGIECKLFSSPVITGCIINSNTASFAGGGIYSGESNSNIFNCVIIDNNAPIGGGISCYYPKTTCVVNCTLIANSANYFGGAVYCWDEGIANIENSILWANSASVGEQLGLMSGGVATITYCDIQGGQTDVYDPCGTLVWGSGNINTDPCFASFNVNGDPNIWDFHLQSADGRWIPDVQSWVTDSNTSPCIDTGDPNSDWTDEPWPNGKRINMGAYGGTSQASKKGNPADFDISKVVNLEDFSVFASKWMNEGSCIEDLDDSGLVDLADLSIFAENWLWQEE
jgi:hypothetical protein